VLNLNDEKVFPIKSSTGSSVSAVHLSLLAYIITSPKSSLFSNPLRWRIRQILRIWPINLNCFFFHWQR